MRVHDVALVMRPDMPTWPGEGGACDLVCGRLKIQVGTGSPARVFLIER